MSIPDHAVTLRPGRPDDPQVIAEIWQHGWNDRHLGYIPDDLVAARMQESGRN
ncbi:MAG: hypothetical protein ACR2JX_02750 [Mycobacteriales bacterium]